MAGRGFPPAPTAIKLLKGVQPKRINKREALLPVDVPPMPEHLDEEATAEWRRMSTRLAEVGLLTQVDRTGLAAYCVLYSRWVAAELHVRDEGMLLTSKKGYPVVNPYLRVAQETLAQLLKCLAEFGMTPASRSRIQVETPEPLSDLEAFRRKHDG
jgi:P27 family predicted phage terminase small subunit